MQSHSVSALKTPDLITPYTGSHKGDLDFYDFCINVV